MVGRGEYAASRSLAQPIVRVFDKRVMLVKVCIEAGFPICEPKAVVEDSCLNERSSAL